LIQIGKALILHEDLAPVYLSDIIGWVGESCRAGPLRVLLGVGIVLRNYFFSFMKYGEVNLLRNDLAY